MTTSPSEKYILLESLDDNGALSNVETMSTWRVSIATPKQGSLTERVLGDVSTFKAEFLSQPVTQFFAEMRRLGLPGVLETGNLRGHQGSPLEFCELLTETIADDIPDLGDEDSGVDDFDNHDLSPLREAMVDQCQEFSGEDPDAPDAP